MRPLELALLVAIAVVVAAPVFLRIREKRFDLFEPVVVFAAAYGVMFVVRPVVDLTAGDYDYAISGIEVGIRDTYPEMLALALLGAVAFVLGYGSRYGERLADRVQLRGVDYSGTRLLQVGLAFGLIGLLSAAGFLVFGLTVTGVSPADLLAGRSDALTDVTQRAPKYLVVGPLTLIPAVLIVAAIGWERRDWSLAALAVVLVAVLLVTKGSSGSRITLLPLFGGLAVLYYATKGRRPRGLTVAAVGALALAVSAFLYEARNVERRQNGIGHVAAQTLRDPARVLRPVVEGQDAAMAPALAAALTVIPEKHDFEYGKAVVGDLVVRPIPRALWSAKPRPPRERIIASLWPGLYEAGAANPEFSALLTFYMDWGPGGVLLALLMYGIVARGLYEFFLRHQSTLAARLVFAASLPYIVVGLRDGPVDTISRLAFVLGPLLIAALAARRPRSQPALASSAT